MKKTQISLGGINRNDYDGSAHIVNLRLKDKAFRPVPEPIPVDKEIDGVVDYIHASSDYRNLIGYSYYAEVTSVYFRGDLNTSDTEKSILIGSFKAKVLDVTHIGNTLIFLTDDGQYYFLFKNEKYTMLGNKLPEIKAYFKTGNATDADFSDYADTSTRNNMYHGVYFVDSGTDDVPGLRQSDWEGAVSGTGDLVSSVRTQVATDFEAQYNKCVSEIYSLGVLPKFPLQVRVGIRLYDGTYIYQSAPIVIADGNGKDDLLYSLSSFAESLNRITAYVDDQGIGPYMANGYYYKGTQENGPFREFFSFYSDMNDLYPLPESFDNRGKQFARFLGMERKSFRMRLWNGSLHDFLKQKRLAIKTRTLKAKIDWDKSQLEDWEDIISSVDIFISKPETPVKIGELGGFPVADAPKISGAKPILFVATFAQYNRLSFHEKLASYSDEAIADSVGGNGNFYLLKSIDISELDDSHTSWFSLANDIRDNMALIEQNNTLPDDYSSRQSISAKTHYSYNNSLHLANITTKVFKGFAPKELSIAYSEYEYTGKGYCVVDMNTSQGKCVSISEELDNNGCFISPMLYYPDPNAKNIEIGVYDRNGILHKNTFKLKPHPALNGSYYLAPDLKPIELTNDNASMPSEEFSPTFSYPNKLIATSISNPFVFTAERTNYVGSGNILAMHAATTALSQGQSAQLPLYVFCTDGVYTLTSNSEGEYVTSRNVSFDILVDKKKLCSTENAIIFGTRQGLKVIQGGISALLSAPLNGTAHRYEPGENYENPFLQEFITQEDTRDFNTFLCDENTSVYYDYPNNEVWVFNPRSEYAYILSISNNAWSLRHKGTADRMVNAYPSLYLRDNTALIDVTQENPKKMPFAIITNPIGGQEFTRIQDITIDTRFITNDMQCTLLAGNNPFRLTKIKTLKVSPDKTANPVPIPALHLGRIPASVRYAQFAIKGNASDAMLTGFTMLTDTESYNPVR